MESTCNVASRSTARGSWVYASPAGISILDRGVPFVASVGLAFSTHGQCEPDSEEQGKGWEGIRSIQEQQTD